VRTTSAVLAALVMAAAGACSSPGGELGGPTTTTTGPDGPTTSTTSPDGPGPDGPGPDSPDGPCEQPPDWAYTMTTTIEPTRPDEPDEPDESDDPDEPGGGTDPDDPTGSGCTPTPEPAPAPAPSPGPDPEPELGTGDVQITLRWTSAADLDLHVFEPDGTEIYFSSPGPTATGGQLDVDSNVGCEQEASVENVFWPDGEMPLGDYRVVITGYEVEGCGSGDYALTASVRGQPVLDEAGTVAQDEEDEFGFVAT